MSTDIKAKTLAERYGWQALVAVMAVLFLGFVFNATGFLGGDIDLGAPPTGMPIQK